MFSRNKIPRVLFYFYKSLHVPIMMPVYREFSNYSGFEIAVSSPLNEARSDMHDEFKAGDKPILPVHEVPFFKEPQAFKPDLVFISDAVTQLVHDCGKIINIGHGLLSKGFYYTDTDFINRENLEDLLLVPGGFQRTALEKSRRVFTPVEAVGYPKLDWLFQRGIPTRNDLCESAGLDPAKKIILYAPTFNIELSAIPIIWTRIRELATDDRYLLIKLHSCTIPEFVEAHIQLAEQIPNIRFISDLDITPYMQVADLMVSDVSSAYMEFMLLDKPVVLFNNPNQQKYPLYNPEEIEYAWRDVGMQVSTLDEMKEAVDQSLAHPEEYSNIRNFYRDKLNIKLDGRASQRVLAIARELLETGIERCRLHQSGKITVLLTGELDDPVKIKTTIINLRELSGEKVEITLLDNGSLTGHEKNRKTLAELQIRVVSLDNLESLFEGSEFICLIPVGSIGLDRWLFRLINHLRRNLEIEAIVPLSSNCPESQQPDRYLQDFKLERTQAMLDLYLRTSYVANEIASRDLPRSDLGVIRIGSSASKTAIQSFSEPDCNPFTQAKLALDVLIAAPPQLFVKIENSSISFAVNDEKRIAELAAQIGSIIPLEDDGKREKRYEAEKHLERARYFIGRGNHVRAINNAEQALAAYPGSKAALHVIDQARYLVNQTEQVQ